MTLNLTLTSRTAVYLSGDFRITYSDGRWEDDPRAQKLVPVFRLGWSALVSFAGIAKTNRGLDVGDWIAEQLQGIEMDAGFEELPRRLLAANAWLSKVPGSNPLVFSIVGFIRRRPVAMIISNFTDISGRRFDPLKPQLSRSQSRPKTPEVRVAGDIQAIRTEEIGKLKKMLDANCEPLEVRKALAEANAVAAQRASTISRACVTSHLLPTGEAEVQPFWIGEDQVEYLPGFVKRDLFASGVYGFKSKVDKNGAQLPPRWVGMTAKVQGGRGKKTVEVVARIHAFANVEGEPLSYGSPDSMHVFWKVAGEDEPDRYTVQIGNPPLKGSTVPFEPMEVGEHNTKKFEPAFQFTVGEGWGTAFSETDDGLCLGIGPEGGQLIFANPLHVFDPSNPSERKEVPAPENADKWIAWFQQHPNLGASNPVPASVGGASGVRIDATATSTLENYPQDDCGGYPCVPLFPTGRTPIVSFLYSVGLKEQFIILDIKGKTVIVNIAAPVDKFNEFLPKAQEVLDTVEWKGAQSPHPEAIH